MSNLVFEPWPKIGRLRRECTITEKLDGTNAQICFGPEGELLVGSRKREIFPNGTVPDSVPNPDGTIKYQKGTDNYGFAQWVHDNRDDLFEFLGEGRHFGEWYGGGIQRGYGLETKRFALFNTGRFGPGRQEIPLYLESVGLESVPVIYQGAFSTEEIDEAMYQLKMGGSFAAAFRDPEGIIVYHHALRSYAKVTFDHDDGKWNA